MWNRINSFRISEEEIDRINERLWEVEKKSNNRPCPDCGCTVGEVHQLGCDISRCTKCGGQELSCDCEQENREVWDGMWPGSKECYEQKLICCWDESRQWMYDFNELARRRT